MTLYLEPRFLACLLLKVPGRRPAWELIRRFSAPYPLNCLHVLQTEGMLFKGLAGPDAASQAAVAGLTLWNYYRGEGVFPIQRAHWDLAFEVALRMNRESEGRGAEEDLPSPLQYLHAGLALTSRCTHFVSFEPAARQAAHAAGLDTLPEQLV